MKRRLPESMHATVKFVERNDSPGGVNLVNPAKIAKKDYNELVQLAMDIDKADMFLYANACNKLQVISQQMRQLQEQARLVLKETTVNNELHHVACNFVKVPGNTYHLYERPSGQKYFSMLSPEEWCSPHKFHESYRLEQDHSWTPTSEIDIKNDQLMLINKILASNGRSNLSLGSPMDM